MIITNEELKAQEITVAKVKELRERTGCDLMRTKQALVQTSGDLRAAFEILKPGEDFKED